VVRANTERERTEADLRRRAAVAEDTDDALTAHDAFGLIVAWSRGAERMYGYPRDEALRLNVEDLVPEAERPRARGLLEAERRGEEVVPLEVSRLTKDGRTLQVWLTTTRLLDDQGRAVGVATTERDITDRKQLVEVLRESVAAEGRSSALLRTITSNVPDPILVGDDRSPTPLANPATPEAMGKPAARDVTDRKRAEDALRASEERFRLLVQGVKDCAIYMLAPDGTVTSWSAAAEQIFGYREEEIVGRHRACFYTEEDRWAGEPRRDLDEAAARGRCEHEAWRIRKDGSPLWANVLITALRDDAGNLRGFASVTRDFTERRKSETALRESEERLRLAQQVARVGTFEWDIKAGVNTWTPELEALYGLPRGGFAGTEDAWENLVHPDDRAEAVRRVEQALETGRVNELEWRVVWPDGTVHWLAGRWQVFMDSAGKPARMTGINIDITERKRMEELRASEAALREADRQKNQFLAMLSHELRNPLAPIRNSLYLLERAAPGGEQARRAQAVIDRQVGQLTRLIDDLLDVTRIVSGKVRLQREGLDLNELVQRTADDHRTLFLKSDVRLEVLPAPVEVRIDGDWIRLAQAVGNLLQNAAKFTPRGGKTTVSVEADLARGQAVVTVKDTGSGIHPEMLPRLFRAFTQADATLDRSKGGLGLGLALVKGLAELHGGSVSAASDGLGKGAVFTVRLPLDRAALRAMPPGRDLAGAGASRRVLVVEDNEDAADTLREVLELGHHVVDVVYSGRGAIEKARDFRPDVVLCDIGLPEMDGYEVARTMRADPELARVTLIAVSGYAQPEDVALAREAGFDAHLAKPPSIETLRRVLAELGHAPGRGPGANGSGHT
jgi:two-component system CheB/CheR fusion protein